MSPASVAQQASAPPMSIAPPPAPSGLRIGTSTAPPPPVAASSSAPPRMTTPVRPQPQRGNHGWATSETSFNTLGSYIMLVPSILGAMLSAGFFGVELPPMILGVIVAVCGLVGGIINILGRGPIAVGMLVGLVMAFGWYGTVYWWINGRTSVRTLGHGT